MQRIAVIFTCLVFSILIGGILSRSRSVPQPPAERFEPTSAPILPPIVDPLGAARLASDARQDRARLRVVDPAGAPVVGAALILRSGDSTIWTFTDADGAATLEGLPPGKSRLAVLAFPHLGQEFDIQAGSEVLQLTLAPAAEVPTPIPDFARSKFAGRLIWTGSVVPVGYEVLLLPVSAPSELGGALPRAAVTDDTGGFSFDALAHGRYFVRVLPPWARSGSWPDLTAIPNRELDFRGATAEHGIELRRGRIEGEVRDDLGRALEGALVLASEVGNEAHVWPPSSSGPDGRFRFLDLPPGKYRVICRAGEGGSAIEELTVEADAAAWAALPPFAARRR